jgi:formylmethanofuran dehydrogenase subunit D
MGLETSTPIKITTDYGSVTVHWAPDKALDSGTVFFPYGPWANQVCASSTSSTGMPIMKGIPAKVEASGEEVNTLEEIVEKLRRGA